MATCKHPEGCPRPATDRGWCKAHDARVRRNGHPGPAAIKSRRPSTRPCRIDGCVRAVGHSGKDDMCEKHAARARRHGSPDIVLRRGAMPGESNLRWSGDQASYSAVHARVRKDRGPARDHTCVGCGSPALHWSYDNSGVAERLDPRHGRYSTDLTRYQPRCIPCHSAFDRAARGLTPRSHS